MQQHCPQAQNRTKTQTPAYAHVFFFTFAVGNLFEALHVRQYVVRQGTPARAVVFEVAPSTPLIVSECVVYVRDYEHMH